MYTSFVIQDIWPPLYVTFGYKFVENQNGFGKGEIYRPDIWTENNSICLFP